MKTNPIILNTFFPINRRTAGLSFKRLNFEDFRLQGLKILQLHSNVYINTLQCENKSRTNQFTRIVCCSFKIVT